MVPKMTPEIIRISTRGPGSMAHSFLFSKGGAASWYEQARVSGTGPPTKAMGMTLLPPVSPRRMSMEPEITWHLLSNGVLALLGFVLLGTQHPFLLPDFLLLKWECSSYAYLTIVFGKGQTVWFHRTEELAGYIQEVTNSLTWLSTATALNVHTHTHTRTHIHTHRTPFITGEKFVSGWIHLIHS